VERSSAGRSSRPSCDSVAIGGPTMAVILS
jgi:hypothetical protein